MMEPNRQPGALYDGVITIRYSAECWKESEYILWLLPAREYYEAGSLNY